MPWTHHVVFQLSQEWYVLPVEQVRAIERWHAPTPVPGTPPAIIGIINQRGMLVPVIDARVLLNLPLDAPTRSSRLLFTHAQATDFALITDQVADMLTLDPTSLEDAPARASTLISGLVMTPFGRASMLDLEAVLNTVRLNY